LKGHTKLVLLLTLVLGALVARSPAQGVNVTGRVAYYGSATPPGGISAVVWLVPVGSQTANAPALKPTEAVLRQKNKAFEPHLLVVTKGSTVEFPNLDPWFHNVFSLFDGKKFDLGLYEAGTTRTVHFDREGVSYIFCNIHPEMSAVVVVVSSPYYAVAAKTGEFSIANVPPGRYMLHLWTEKSLPETLAALSREVELSGTMRSVGTLRVRETESATIQHKNKYGQDYEPPSPNNPVYTQP
jgi:plastocyanin